MASTAGNSLKNSFDCFDEFLRSRGSEETEEVVEEEVMEEELFEEILENGSHSSSSSYYEEEIIEDPLARTSMRLDTVHEDDVSDSEDDEDDSESDALWEEYSESFQSPSSNNLETRAKKAALRPNSDMIARVRYLLQGNIINQSEGSLVDISSRCGSESEDGGGSSSVLPFDFDMGSYQEGEINASDEEEDAPEDYEEACRFMIATVHPKLDPNTMIHGCDLRHLYRNLKQQYGHVLRTAPQADGNVAEPIEEELVVTEDGNPNNFFEMSFSNIAEPLEEAPAVVEDDNSPVDDDPSNFVEVSSKSSSESHGDVISPEPVVNDFTVEDTNNAPKTGNHFSNKKVATSTSPPKVEKWLERNADDPDDPEYVCRLLCSLMYDPDSPDYDVDNMLRRSTPIDLYRYLKHHYWYLAHSNQLDENGMYISKENAQEGDKEEQPNEVEDSTMMEINSGEGQPPSNNVESLRAFFANRTEKPEQSNMKREEIGSDSKNKNTEIQEENTFDGCDQTSEMELNEINKDANSDSQNIQIETESLDDFDQALETELNASSQSDNDQSITETFDDYDQASETEWNEVNEDTSSQGNNDQIETESLEDASSQGDNDQIETETFEDASSQGDNDQIETETFEDASPQVGNDQIETGTFNDYDQPSETELNKTNDDADSHSQNVEVEVEMPGSLDEHEMEDSPIIAQKISDDHGEPSDRSESDEDPSQKSATQNSLNESSVSSSEENETSAHDTSVKTLEEKIDKNEPYGEASVQEISNQNSLNGSTSREEANLNESHSDKSNDYFTENEEPAQENVVRNNTLSDNSEKSSSEEGSMHSSGEDVFMNETCIDETIDNLDDTEESPQGNADQNSLDGRTERPSAEKENSVHSSEEDISMNEPYSVLHTDNLGDTEESPQGDIGQNAPDNSTVSSSTEKESLDDAERQDTDMNETFNDSTDSLWEQYSKEYNGILARKNNGEEVDENRLRLLALSVKYIRGQRLTEDEIGDVEEFFDQQCNVEEENEGSTEESLKTDSGSEAHSLGDVIDSEHCEEDRSEDENSLGSKMEALSEKDDSSHVSKPLQDARNEARRSHKEGRRPLTDPKELKWRKTKIEEDLKSIIEETEVLERRQRISSEIVAALRAGSLRTALTKKYYDSKQRDYVYYPSVAKALQNFSLIEEAEKAFRNEFSFELSTALCSVAASRTKGNENEIDENDLTIRKATVNVVLDESLHQSTISLSDSFGDSGGKSRMESPAELLSGGTVRKKRIKNDLARIVKDAEEDHLRDTIEEEAIDALVRAANEVVFIKKYYDVDTDMFKYFPSVKNTILNSSLMERAEDFYFSGVQDFPLDYTAALRASAARFRADFIEVNELDDYVINMAVDVDIDEDLEENQLEKCRDFSTTNDTASMMSSQTTESPPHEQKSFNDSNELKDVNLAETGESFEKANNQRHDKEIGEASSDEKAPLLMEKYLADRQKIDEALIDLESELVAELNRLDKEASECNLKHKIEAERIENDRRGVEEKALADEKTMTQETKALQEKLSTTIATLESERKNTSSGMDTVETEKDESKSWGWFNTKTKKNSEDKQKQAKFKLREVELKKDIADIKAQLGLVKQQAKTKRRNIIEWRAELDEEYRHLDNLTSATEEKLKEEMRHLQTSYEEERQRLLGERSLLEESRSQDDNWTASEKKKMDDENELAQGEIPRATNKRDGTDNAIDEGYLDEKIVGLEREGGIMSDESNVTRQDNLLESSAPIPGEDVNCAGKDIDAESCATDNFENEVVLESTNMCCEGDESIRSNATDTAEEKLADGTPVDKDGNSFIVDATGIEEEKSSMENGDSNVPDHLAFLNQPREEKDEVSLGSFDIFDLPEDKVSSRDLSGSKDRSKSKEEKGTKPSEQATQAGDGPIPPQDPPKEEEDKFFLGSPVTPNASKVRQLSSKRFLAAALKGKQQATPAVVEDEAMPKTEDNIEHVSSSPGKSLRDMRRKVEDALERAMAIRNGEPSSRHSRSIPVQNGSIRSLCVSPLSTSRHSVNPIYPMIRETDRLSGFIRRYEKKLETVCKSLLTLASVTHDEKKILAAKQLDLPEMLEFVVNQDWYKAHSTDKESDAPHLLFSKLKNGNGGESAGNTRYMIADTGKSFLRVDGPVPSDLSRFLTYLSKIEDGLTRDAMLAQWKEIAQLSGDDQSQRVCDKLDKLISFCIDTQMIKK